MEVAAFDEAVVDKKELLAPGLFRHTRLAHEAPKGHGLGFFFDRYQFFVRFFTQNAYRPLPRITGRQVIGFGAVVMKREENVGIGQRDANKFIGNVAHLYTVRFEKISPGRDVEEKIFNRNTRADRTLTDFVHL